MNHSSTPAAERMRQYRRRRRHRARPIKIELDVIEIDALVKRRYLEPTDRDDLTAIGDAASALIWDVLIDT